MNTPLCIHLRKAPRRFHFNAVHWPLRVIVHADLVLRPYRG